MVDLIGPQTILTFVDLIGLPTPFTWVHLTGLSNLPHLGRPDRPLKPERPLNHSSLILYPPLTLGIALPQTQQTLVLPTSVLVPVPYAQSGASGSNDIEIHHEDGRGLEEIINTLTTNK